ncbi:MAG: hypothetical protein E6K04_08625 [Methanobacteriota archaeon]|nr:MAG: hypothetical protein E6K04_08625 [Euryarchaeota archaeon]
MEHHLPRVAARERRDLEDGLARGGCHRRVQRRVRVDVLRLANAGADARPSTARPGVPRRLVEFRCRRFCGPRSDPRVVGPEYRQAGNRIDAGSGLRKGLRHDDELDGGTRCGERQCALEHLEGEGVLLALRLQQLPLCWNLEWYRRFNESGGPGEVVALWEGNGSVAWRHPTGSIHYSSPAYADGAVYVGVMGRYNTTSQVTFDPPYGVLSLDAATGMEHWFFATLGSVAASPAVLGPNVIVPAKDGTVYALNRSTGALAWEASVDAGISSPAVFGDTVFVGGGAFGSPGRVVALNSDNGSVKWSFRPNGPVQSSITYAAGRIVFASNEDHGTIYAVNAASGTLAWSFEPSPSDYILGSPVVADGVVYAPSDNGHVYALGQVRSGP